MNTCSKPILFINKGNNRRVLLVQKSIGETSKTTMSIDSGVRNNQNTHKTHK